MRKDRQDAQLNRLGEFSARQLERAYFTQYAESCRTMTGRFSVAMALGFMLLLAFDYFVLGHSGGDIFLGAVVRLLVFMLGVGYCVLTKKMKNSVWLMYLFMLNVAIYIASYQLLVVTGGGTAFSDQSMAFIVIVFALAMIPARWLFALLLAIATTASFFICHLLFFPDAAAYQYMGYLIYFIIAICVGGYFSHNLQVQRRIQYYRENQLEKLSTTDGLTQVNNRQAFDTTFSAWTQLAAAGGEGFALVMFDLDDFKKLNDSRGHTAGDQVLVETARVVLQHLRGVDVLARWGGEEFTVLLPGGSLQSAAQIAERLRAALQAHFEGDAGITASFGVTQFRQWDTTNSIIQRADDNLYAAKRSGKNRVVADE